MRGYFYDPVAQHSIQLIQAVNLFAFPSGIQPISPPRKAWAIGAIANVDVEYRVGPCRGEWLQRPRNSLHVYAPRCPYQCKNPEHNGELKSSWLTFYANEEFALQDICDEQGFAQVLDPQHRVIKLINQCADVCERRREKGFFAAQAILAQIVDRLLQVRRGPDHVSFLGRTEPRRKLDSLVVAVNNYIHKHLTELIRLEDVAEACHVSLSTLSHRYREVTGESPLGAQAHLRILQAKQRILVGESISQIAEDLGYADVYHFSKSFKKIAGTSPRAFLRQYQQQ